MSLFQHLYATYERCAGNEPDGAEKLAPIAHTTQQAQIEVVIDGDGNFRRASVLDKKAGTTLIPCTEESGGRSGKKPAGHPLCDKLQYIAGDYLAYGGEVTSGYADDPEAPHREYIAALTAWTRSEYTHPKVVAILNYVQRACVVRDLAATGVLPVDDRGKLIDAWLGDGKQAPAIFKSLSATQSPQDAFVRWVVEADSDPASGTWQDARLTAAWAAYYATSITRSGLCMVQGKDVALASQHPAKLRNAGDKAKLISANDTTGFTFRGRFRFAPEAASVGYEVTQKAHNALRWLIRRQGFVPSGGQDQALLCWSVGGEPIPDPWKSTFDLEAGSDASNGDGQADTAQAFAARLKRSIRGYSEKLDPTSDIIIAAFDSAGGNQGRLALTYYRELKGSEFLDRLERWHARAAWHQNFGKHRQFIGAPAPYEIAEAAFGRRLDTKLKKATIERLLPCIVDGVRLPFDVVLAMCRRAANRAGFKPRERADWEKCLGIACGTFRGYHAERDYQMTLEADRVSRDYLYGRLLAVADNIEQIALSVAGEKRETNAARLMQRFADRPFSTWRTIETSLVPYMSRLRAKRSGALHVRKHLLDDIHAKFANGDYADDRPLSGEFLLAYHLQRRELLPPTGRPDATTNQSSITRTEGAPTDADATEQD